MPNYAKAMKEFLSKKRRFGAFETVVITTKCSLFLQNRRLGVGEARSTTVTLQLADRSIAHLKRKIECVLVCVDQFIVPTNFIILEFEADKEVPIVLGRPFLAPSRTLIDAYKGEFAMRVQDEMTFNVLTAIRYPDKFGSTYTEEGVIAIVENNNVIPTRTITSRQICGDDRKLNRVTQKDHFLLPFLNQMLDRLVGQEYIFFLDEYGWFDRWPFDTVLVKDDSK
ncbi:Transposon Ty3-I Gag-Pol polyprotein [Gossypium australe]|uniref:Transposon Ty3-I Gag-Pol polyprotein n=1 Tax=Gossypium australe TaxID=47621 RepID=A0A5B6VV01_9ROSI|nr:Transposon Ty3-I Gag-Pol polyprotein [Gossypium australe]